MEWGRLRVKTALKLTRAPPLPPKKKREQKLGTVYTGGALDLLTYDTHHLQTPILIMAH